jgi:hypothetical protein
MSADSDLGTDEVKHFRAEYLVLNPDALPLELVQAWENRRARAESILNDQTASTELKAHAHAVLHHPMSRPVSSEQSDLTSGDFSINAVIKPLCFPDIVRATGLPSIYLDTSVVQIVSPYSAHQGDIFRAAGEFFMNSKQGPSESGLHMRNGGLLNVISIIASLKIHRDVTSDSTISKSRVDAYLFGAGLPPVILVEEKARARDLGASVNELQRKFVAVPHYNTDLQFIIGIAIAEDFVRFTKLFLHGGRELLDPVFDLSLERERTS